MKTKELSELSSKDLTEGLAEMRKRVTDTARNVGETTDRYVHDYAWTSMAFAAVIGCVIGYLMGSRRD